MVREAPPTRLVVCGVSNGGVPATELALAVQVPLTLFSSAPELGQIPRLRSANVLRAATIAERELYWGGSAALWQHFAQYRCERWQVAGLRHSWEGQAEFDWALGESLA